VASPAAFEQTREAKVRAATKVGMKKRLKTEINLEIEEAVTIRTRRVMLADCSQCQRRVRMVPANEAVLIARQNAREIYRLVEENRLHFIEDRDGLLFVCLASLCQLLDAGYSATDDKQEDR
jgi:hypothetical protein